MFTTAAMRKQLRLHMEALDALDEEIPKAVAEASRALAAYQTAQRRVTDLCLRQDTLTKDADSIISALNTMATFPFELLSLIFAFANTQEDWMVQHIDERLEPRPVDTNRARLPYRLGSVCRHWRNAVLSTPAAWNYIGVSYKITTLTVEPSSPRSSPMFRLFKALERSGSVALEVVIHSRGGWEPDLQDDDADKALSDEESFFGIVFLHLHGNMHRVKILHINGSYLVPHRIDTYRASLHYRVIDLLRTPTPQLSELRVSFITGPRRTQTNGEFWLGFPSQPFPMLLPAAPKLRELSVTGTPIVCRRPHLGLPSLRVLKLRLHSMNGEHLYGMLAISPSLEHLSLNVKEELNPENSSGAEPACPVSKLVVVNQSFGLLADGARLLPKLHHLVIHDVSELSVTTSLAQRLTVLAIKSQDDLHEHVDTLRRLVNIEHVVFGQGTTIRDDLFFEPFLDPLAPMWPKLRSLQLNDVEMLSVEQDGILSLLQARNPPLESGGLGKSKQTARRIENIELYGGLPQWMEIQVRAILMEQDSD